MVYGPVTAEENLKYKEQDFLTNLIIGDEAIIILIEPIESKELSILRISKVVHAYKYMFPFVNKTVLRGASLSCNNDITCDPTWIIESDAVANVLVAGGTAYCSGALLNNTAQDYKPYFLTAFHCLDISSPYGELSSSEKASTQNFSFIFQYRSTTCNGSVVRTTKTYNSASFKAAWVDTDFALLQLNNNITHFPVTFLGWDKSGSTPSKGTTIHHPKGDLMKISYDNHSLTSYSGILGWENNIISPPNRRTQGGYQALTSARRSRLCL